MRSTSNRTGATLASILEARGLSQYAVAKRGVPQSSLSATIHGLMTPGADWLNMVASACDMSDEERKQLHRAAVLDHGFDVDL